MNNQWQESWEEKFIDPSKTTPIYKACTKKIKSLNSSVESFETWMEVFKGKLGYFMI